MTVLKRRSRMVNFRLSEEEYREFKSLCIANGARSLSDFARAAVCHLVGTNGSSGKFETTVQHLSGRVQQLDSEVKRLARLVEGSKGVTQLSAVSSQASPAGLKRPTAPGPGGFPPGPRKAEMG